MSGKCIPNICKIYVKCQQGLSKTTTELFCFLSIYLIFSLIFLVLVEQILLLPVLVRQGKRKHRQRSRVKINLILLNLFRAFNYRVCQKLKRQKKLCDVQEKVVQTGNLQTKSSKTNLIRKDQHIYNSFIRRHSSLARKSMPKDPEQAVAVLFHVYQQFSKSPHKSHF